MLFDRFELVDAAVKVVGVGSVGTRCYVALLLAAPDPLFRQVKEARRSVLEPPRRVSAAGWSQRTACCGRAAFDAMFERYIPGLGREPNGRDFYVRQLRDMKVAPDIEAMNSRMLRAYAKLCGRALARAHDKAGDAAMIAGYLGGSDEFDEAIGDYAVAYADQSARDYASFAKAVRVGELKTDTGLGWLETALR
jgi:uncharacterized protein (DUF2252 family)